MILYNSGIILLLDHVETAQIIIQQGYHGSTVIYSQSVTALNFKASAKCSAIHVHKTILALVLHESLIHVILLHICPFSCEPETLL